MRKHDRVVGFDDGRGYPGRGVDGEADLGLLPVLHRQLVQEERSEPRPCAWKMDEDHSC